MNASHRSWRQVLPDVWCFRDSCNVYALRGPDGMLLIDAGTGAWLEHLDELPAPPAALLCTHYFRDHSAGAVRAARTGIPIYVPEYEQEIFEDPIQHYRQRDTYIIYDNIWDLFAPIEPVRAAGLLRDYDRPVIGGAEVEIIPLSGAAVSQVGIGARLRDGRDVVFCAEAIHSPGRLPRIAPLQYNYNDLEGAMGCYSSAALLRHRRPAALLPSLGEPILEDVDSALAQLQTNLRRLCAGRPEMQGPLDRIDGPPLKPVTDHVWQALQSNSINWFLISRSGKAMAIDYGYQVPHFGWSTYSKRERRRPLLHSISGLKQQFGIDRIDVVLVSHFHDDHVCGIPLLQRLFDTKCWVPENFADLLAHPEAHCFPCGWPVPIRVDRRLPLDQTVQWEEFTFHFAPMSGHTRFAALIGFEADGKRFAHTGDQYFFIPEDEGKPFAQRRRKQNHVYRNGALLDGFDLSGRWMLRWRPQVVLQGHQEPFFTDDAFFAHIERWSEEYRQIHQQAMVLGQDEPHFNLDSWGGWIWPFRVHLHQPQAAEVSVTVRNPLPHPAELLVRLVGPEGWTGTSATVRAEPRAEVSCNLRITPSGPCRRQPFAAELFADGRPFGQVAVALMSVGERF